MNMPLCSFCIKSGIFCQKCQNKVDLGQIGETDIKIAKLLMTLEQRYPSLQKIRFHNAFEVDSVLAIVVGRGHLSAFFENNGKIVREIAQDTGKRVRVIEKHGEVRRFPGLPSAKPWSPACPMIHAVSPDICCSKSSAWIPGTLRRRSKSTARTVSV